MATLGEELKSAREAKGLTLSEISERTRISHTFLKALEEDNYSIIPGEVFVTGFLRTYAKLLGLSEKEILDKYRELRPAPPKETQPPAPENQQHQARPSLIRIRRGGDKKPARKVPVYMVVLTGLLLGGFLTGITLLLTPKGEQVQPPPVQEAQPLAPAPAFAPATTVFGSATAFEPDTAVLKLKLTAMDNSWYATQADKGPKNQGVLQKGQSIEIDAKEEITLDVGNSGGVEIIFNGRKLGPFGGTNEVVRNILFTKDKPGVVQPTRKGQIPNVMRGNDPSYMVR